MITISTYQAALVVVHYLAALALLWSCFCRFTHTSRHRTRVSIRLAFGGLSSVAVACLVAPLIPAYTGGRWLPDTMHVAMLISITGVQIVTAWHWKRGVPPQFRTDSERAALEMRDAVRGGEL